MLLRHRASHKTVGTDHPVPAVSRRERAVEDAAHYWAMAAVQRDNAGRTKYRTLRSRGHIHAHALLCIADLFLNVVSKMIETGQFFGIGR